MIEVFKLHRFQNLIWLPKALLQEILHSLFLKFCKCLLNRNLQNQIDKSFTILEDIALCNSSKDRFIAEDRMLGRCASEL